MRKLALIIGVCSVLLTACGGTKQLPSGVQTLEGVLSPVEFSLSRRGTHVLTIDGTPRYYVESRTISLFDHEGHMVTVKGMIEANLGRRDLPVLVVQRIDDPEATLRTWRIPALSIELDVPSSWAANIDGPIVGFTASGSRVAALTVFKQQVATLSFDPKLVTNDSGSSLTPVATPILGRTAIAEQVPERQLLIVYVPVNDNDVLTFQFSEQGMQKISNREVLIQRIVDSIKAVGGAFSSSESSSDTAVLPVSASGSSVGKPCGGSAGILCSQGFYCEINDTVNNVGKCVAL